MDTTQKGRLILSGAIITNSEKQILLLLKKTHNHYELPGGKVNLEECKDSANPTLEELSQNAEREAYEELGDDIVLDNLIYFAKIEFMIPDGRQGLGYNFTTRIISGKPRINEPDNFSDLKYFDIDELDNLNIAPNLRLLLPKLRELQTTISRFKSC